VPGAPPSGSVIWRVGFADSTTTPSRDTSSRSKASRATVELIEHAVVNRWPPPQAEPSEARLRPGGRGRARHRLGCTCRPADCLLARFVVPPESWRVSLCRFPVGGGSLVVDR